MSETPITDARMPDQVYKRTMYDHIQVIEHELELERLRLAACGVVALADTDDSEIKAREMLPEYRSAALSDVERRVDECIKLREQLAYITKQRDALAEALEWYAEKVKDCRKITREGDDARVKLAQDYGNLAEQALAAVKGGSYE